ncbi:MAG TPA: VWA domain-containing protein [Vicinamibacterales bacterium]|nr:VWA domain-containing protein [Vicinamibacterales bacterium]
MIWTSPAALWLLALVPLVWLSGRFSRTNFNRRQNALQVIVRSLVLTALAVALARPVIELGSSRVSVVYVVDVSYSVSSRSVTEAAAKIAELNASLNPDHSRIVAFGRHARVVPDGNALTQLVSAQGETEVDRSASDLDAALAAARAELAPGHVPRLVLFSDGRATTGDVAAAVTQLKAAGIPVHVFPLAPRELGDTWVEALRLPARLAPGGLIAAIVDVGSQKLTSALVEVRNGEKVLGTKTVTVTPGTTPVPVDISVDEAGAVTLEARVTAVGDPLGDNNKLTQAAWVAPRPRVLYVEGTPSSSQYLTAALEQSGFDVAVRPAAGLPSTAQELAPYDVVILSDIARSALPDPKVAVLATWVEQNGGGLLVAGGESVFGEDGYRESPLERLLPVTFERKDEPEVALVMVLDKSWSMAGTNIEMLRVSAQAAVDVMKDEHTLGIIMFNDSLEWTLTPRQVGPNRELIKKTIAAIEPSGHTLIFPAVEQAYLALQKVKARAKHVLLLSDGRSYPDDYETLVNKMVAEKMTVSSVAMGAAADRELLANIAKWGKGRNYAADDPKDVPQIFVKEAKDITSPGFDEKLLNPVVKHAGFLDGIDFKTAPKLRGRTATVIKDTALELIQTEEEDPLLAYWPIGAGRAAVFASDVKDRWAADWLRWRGYGPFFSAIVRELAGQRFANWSLDLDVSPARGVSRNVRVIVDAREPDGRPKSLLRPKVRVDAGGTPRELVARQIGPGRYEASLTVDAGAVISATLVDDTLPATAGLSRRFVPDSGSEYRFRAPDNALLSSLAASTGGRVGPDAEALRRAGTDSRAARRAMWPGLVLFSLVGWAVDLLLRRVRLFER